MVTIAILEAGSGRGGSFSYLFSFLKHLDRTRYDPVVVLYQQAEGRVAGRIRELGIEVVPLREQRNRRRETAPAADAFFPGLSKASGYLRFLAALAREDIPDAYKLLRIMREREIGLLLLNNETITHIPGVIAAKIAGVPCVIRKSGVSTLQSRRLRRFLYRFGEVFIASSKAEYESHIAGGFPYRKMTVVYEGVDTGYFRPGPAPRKLRPEWGISPERFVVCSASRLDEGKGHEVLLQAACLVVRRRPDAVFLLAGDEVGPGDTGRFGRLREAAAALGIADNVVFAGWRDDIRDLLQEIDVFVHCPTVPEGLGIATLEAIACGKPVVVTDSGGLAETTVDGYNGFVVPAGDPARLAEKILRLAGDRALREAMGRNSRARALAQFDIARNIRMIERTMDEIRGALS